VRDGRGDAVTGRPGVDVGMDEEVGDVIGFDAESGAGGGR